MGMARPISRSAPRCTMEARVRSTWCSARRCNFLADRRPYGRRPCSAYINPSAPAFLKRLASGLRSRTAAAKRRPPPFAQSFGSRIPEAARLRTALSDGGGEAPTAALRSVLRLAAREDARHEVEHVRRALVV